MRPHSYHQNNNLFALHPSPLLHRHLPQRLIRPTLAFKQDSRRSPGTPTNAIGHLPQRLIRPTLAFKQDSGRSSGTPTNAIGLLHIQQPWLSLRIKDQPLCFLGVLVIEQPLNLPSENHRRLRRSMMPMDRPNRPALKHNLPFPSTPKIEREEGRC